MRARQFERLARIHLLPHLSGFAVKRDLLFLQPVADLLRGFAFEGSGFDRNAFNVWAFVQPLYIPLSYLFFTFGGRLGTLSGGQERWWELTEANERQIMEEVLALMVSEGLPFLRALGTPGDLADRAAEITHAPDDIHVLEGTAYSLVLDGRHDEAARALIRVHEVAASMPARADWRWEIDARARQVEDALARDPEEAAGLLKAWRDQTVSALGLGDERPKKRAIAKPG